MIKNNLELSYWAVAFIDLLGQNEKLKKITHLPENPDKNIKFQNLIKDTFIAVDNFHVEFKKHFDNFLRKKPKVSLPIGLSKSDFAHAKRAEVKFQRFSDGLVAFTCLKPSESNLPMNGISAMLGALGILMPAFLAKGCPFRCGVDVGIGMEMNLNELYGPALSKAYYLESKVAQLPRIVLGDELIGYIKNLELSEKDTTDAKISKALAKFWKERFMQDIDGHITLHYLGKPFLSYIRDVKATEYIMDKAFCFIVSELDKFKNSKDTKLALRYAALYDYFTYHQKN